MEAFPTLHYPHLQQASEEEFEADPQHFDSEVDQFLQSLRENGNVQSREPIWNKFCTNFHPLQKNSDVFHLRHEYWWINSLSECLGKGSSWRKEFKLRPQFNRYIRSKEDFRWLEKLMLTKSNSGLIDTLSYMIWYNLTDFFLWGIALKLRTFYWRMADISPCTDWCELYLSVYF